MSERSLRQTYQAIIAAVAAADKNALDHLIAEDIVDHDAVPGQAPGRAGIKYWVTMMHDAFADLRGVVEDIVVECDKMAARVTWYGIQRGDFVGIPGTGAQVAMQSVQILEFTDGVASAWWGTATSTASFARLVPRWLPRHSLGPPGADRADAPCGSPAELLRTSCAPQEDHEASLSALVKLWMLGWSAAPRRTAVNSCRLGRPGI